MLNISKNSVSEEVDLIKFKSSTHVFNKRYCRHFNQFLLVFAIVCFIILFLPWTQNINGRGNVTTLTLDQRPQNIQSQIPGRIEKWFVRECDSLKKWDAIMKISEIKSDYFDSKLVKRTPKQWDAKAFAVKSYGAKVKAQEVRIIALTNERKLKLKQAENKLFQSKLKVQSDSIDFEAAKINNDIANTKFKRAEDLYSDGFVALKNV